MAKKIANQVFKERCANIIVKHQWKKVSECAVHCGSPQQEGQLESSEVCNSGVGELWGWIRSHRVWINTFPAHNRCLLSAQWILHSVTGSPIGKLSPSADFHVTHTSVQRAHLHTHALINSFFFSAPFALQTFWSPDWICPNETKGLWESQIKNVKELSWIKWRVAAGLGLVRFVLPLRPVLTR